MLISPCVLICVIVECMCGKESLENSFLLFVKGLKCLGNWLVRRLYHRGPPDSCWWERLDAWGWPVLLCPPQVVEGQVMTRKSGVSLGGEHALKVRRPSLASPLLPSGNDASFCSPCLFKANRMPAP